MPHPCLANNRLGEALESPRFGSSMTRLRWGAFQMLRTRSFLCLLALVPLIAGAARPPVNSRWTYATSTSTIGLNPPFLERKLGPAKSKNASSWTFEVGRCEITYYIDHDGVTGYSFDLKPGCGSTISGFGELQGMMLTSQTKLAAVQHLDLLHAHYTADCLESCGNAADPVVSLKAEGSRSSGGFNIEFGATIAGSPAFEASNTWAAAYKAKYGLEKLASLPSEASSCDFSLNDVARVAFAPVKIDTIMVGETGSPYRPQCDQLQNEIAMARK